MDVKSTGNQKCKPVVCWN